jgi:hypothetical protein
VAYLTFHEILPSDLKPRRCKGLFCAEYHCSHSLAITGDPWPDDVRLSDLEPKFACKACGRRGADVRPDWNSVEAYAR